MAGGTLIDDDLDDGCKGAAIFFTGSTAAAGGVAGSLGETALESGLNGLGFVASSGVCTG